MAGGVEVPAPVALGMKGSYEKKEILRVKMQASLDTVRSAVSMVLDSVDKPTILILSDRELELLGADIILNAVVGNPNLVVVTFLPTRPSKEFVKLVTSDRTGSINVPIMYSSMKSYIINAYYTMAQKLMPGIRDVVQRKANTKRGIAGTIFLLLNTGILQRVVGGYLYRLGNPMLILIATNKVIAKTYALLQRNPMKMVEFLEKANWRTKKMIKNELESIVVERLMEEAEAETVLSVLNQSAVATIYSMLTKVLGTPKDKLFSLLSKNTLSELDYPILFNRENEYKTIEFMRKVGILSLRATRNGYYTLSPGIEYLYSTIKSLLAVEKALGSEKN